MGTKRGSLVDDDDVSEEDSVRRIVFSTRSMKISASMTTPLISSGLFNLPVLWRV